jgi:hypothetical protein
VDRLQRRQQEAEVGQIQPLRQELEESRRLLQVSIS